MSSQETSFIIDTEGDKSLLSTITPKLEVVNACVGNLKIFGFIKEQNWNNCAHLMGEEDKKELISNRIFRTGKFYESKTLHEAFVKYITSRLVAFFGLTDDNIINIKDLEMGHIRIEIIRADIDHLRIAKRKDPLTKVMFVPDRCRPAGLGVEQWIFLSEDPSVKMLGGYRMTPWLAMVGDKGVELVDYGAENEKVVKIDRACKSLVRQHERLHTNEMLQQYTEHRTCAITDFNYGLEKKMFEGINGETQGGLLERKNKNIRLLLARINLRNFTTHGIPPPENECFSRHDFTEENLGKIAGKFALPTSDSSDDE